MNAKKLIKTLNYLPRWAWYLVSFFILGPLGILAVYLLFHVLGKIEKEQEEAGHDDAHRTVYEDSDCTVHSDDDQYDARQHAGTSRSQKAPGTQMPVFDENAGVDELIRAGYDAMRCIREANNIIEDIPLSAQIDSIEASCAQILSMLEQRPQLLTQLRSFLRYYLPTTLKLLDARARLENSAHTPKAREVRARISEAVGAIDKAFLKQVEALDAYRFIDLESEMDVLRDMLRADGLIEEEENPFSSMPGRQ